jgi:thiosulfate/3-mercaptopyruvate sulfurtransferase
MGKKGYPNERFLVDVAWMREHRDDPRLRLIDARSAGEYGEGHIPGAVNLDVGAIGTANTDPEGVDDFNRRQVAALRAAGVNVDSLVVAYDSQSGASAARTVWVLDYYGHDQVYLLDGGLAAWRAAGGGLTTEVPRVPAGNFAAHPRPAALATYRDILDRLDRPGTVILDTRRRSEYLGTEVRAARGGTIPGAVHLEWLNHLDDRGAVRDADELRALFARHGVTPDQEVIPFCGGGYRSAHAYLVLTMLGYPRVRNYLGSWGEWGNRPELPVETPTDE